jgi:hypothetical protein
MERVSVYLTPPMVVQWCLRGMKPVSDHRGLERLIAVVTENNGGLEGIFDLWMEALFALTIKTIIYYWWSVFSKFPKGKCAFKYPPSWWPLWWASAGPQKKFNLLKSYYLIFIKFEGVDLVCKNYYNFFDKTIEL